MKTEVPSIICSLPRTNTWNPSINTLVVIFFAIVAAILQLNHIHGARHMITRKVPPF